MMLDFSTPSITVSHGKDDDQQVTTSGGSVQEPNGGTEGAQGKHQNSIISITDTRSVGVLAQPWRMVKPLKAV